MKTIFLFLTITFGLNSALADEAVPYKIEKLKEIETDWSLLKEYEVAEYIELANVRDRDATIRIIQKVKELLLSGELEKAKLLLFKIDKKESALKIVVERYESLIAFIEGDMNKVISILSAPIYFEERYFKEICIMKVTAMITKGPSKELLKNIERCELVTADYTKNDHFWLENVRNLFYEKTIASRGESLSDFQWIFADKEYLRIWLKSGLFINNEKKVEEFVDSIPAIYYNSSEIRELLALLYYRLGNVERAKAFVEDLKGPNAENLKGNINLAQKKYELAYGHFKLALGQKHDSRNALERATPIAWLLKLWDEGSDLLHNSNNPKLDERKKISLDTAFKLRANKTEAAYENAMILQELYGKKPPFEVELMIAHLAMQTNDYSQMVSSLDKTCKHHDGMNCYFELQTLIWSNIAKTSKREGPMHRDMESFLDDIKNPEIITPLQEQINIDQRDIEELDGEQIEI